MSSKPKNQPAKAPEPETAKPAPRTALALIIVEDTQDDGPRTWSLVRARVPVETAEIVEMHEQQNSMMIRARGFALLDDWDFDEH